MSDMQQRVELPQLFQERMQHYLGREYEPFRQSYDAERTQGLRFNSLKGNTVEAAGRYRQRFGLEQIPWCPEGYYYAAQTRPGKLALHEAGVYYIQEPSAMAVAELLDAQPGENILDLCASPGGKTSHIASCMAGEGFLLSNEIHPARARVLSQNVERMGIGNAVVSNEDAGTLSRCFPNYFDRILVDAPCSGEGMFRKDPLARTQWSLDHVKLCAARQEEILDHAAAMLKPGGRLVYSTCTFSPEENEMVIRKFMADHPEFSPAENVDLPGWSGGRREWAEPGQCKPGRFPGAFRLWPHLSQGEGHFAAVMVKQAVSLQSAASYRGPVQRPMYVKDRGVLGLLRDFCHEHLEHGQWLSGKRNLVLFGEQLYLTPEGMCGLERLKVARPGLHLGTIKKNRFEPSHGLAMYLNMNQVRRWIDLPLESNELAAYLRGESLRLGAQYCHENLPDDKGWVLVLVQGYSIGWGKLAGGVVKNHYPKGLRRQC